MADRPIAVGDLVMVVRWPHEHICDCYGITDKVAEIEQSYSFCKTCKTTFSAPTAILGGGYAVPVAWLKRLDPDALKDETREEIEA